MYVFRCALSSGMLRDDGVLRFSIYGPSRPVGRSIGFAHVYEKYFFCPTPRVCPIRYRAFWMHVVSLISFVAIVGRHGGDPHGSIGGSGSVPVRNRVTTRIGRLLLSIGTKIIKSAAATILANNCDGAITKEQNYRIAISYGFN